MLEVTVLKTVHMGKNEAEKLAPHVKECDAFSLEMAHMTESEAKNIERSWAGLLKTNMDLTTFLRLLKNRSDRLEYPNQAFREYYDKVNEYLFTEKKPIFYTERWKTIDASKEIAEYQRAHELIGQGMVRLYNNVEDGLKMYYEGEKIRMDGARIRDQNIAQNILRAEQILRETFQIPGRKNPLKLAIQIGAGHQPEKYISAPVKIVDLTTTSEKGKLMRSISNLLYNETPIEEVAPLLREAAKTCVTFDGNTYEVNENY